MIEDGVEALEQGYVASHRVYETCGILATCTTAIWLGARLIAARPPRLWWLGTTLLVGLIGADLISGIVHWAFDTWGDLDTPIVGRLAIRSFRQHHLAPTAMLGHDFIETNGHNMTLALALTIGGLALVPAHDAGVGVTFGGLCLLMMSVCVSFTSQIHKWAHAPRPPRPVRWLQRAGLLLSPAHHLLHHRTPHRQHYCITVGWLDAPLRWTRAFERLERLIERATGIAPRAHAPTSVDHALSKVARSASGVCAPEMP